MRLVGRVQPWGCLQGGDCNDPGWEPPGRVEAEEQWHFGNTYRPGFQACFSSSLMSNVQLSGKLFPFSEDPYTRSFTWGLVYVHSLPRAWMYAMHLTYLHFLKTNNWFWVLFHTLSFFRHGSPENNMTIHLFIHKRLKKRKATHFLPCSTILLLGRTHKSMSLPWPLQLMSYPFFNSWFIALCYSFCQIYKRNCSLFNTYFVH